MQWKDGGNRNSLMLNRVVTCYRNTVSLVQDNMLLFFKV